MILKIDSHHLQNLSDLIQVSSIHHVKKKKKTDERWWTNKHILPTLDANAAANKAYGWLGPLGAPLIEPHEPFSAKRPCQNLCPLSYMDWYIWVYVLQVQIQCVFYWCHKEKTERERERCLTLKPKGGVWWGMDEVESKTNQMLWFLQMETLILLAVSSRGRKTFSMKCRPP